MLCQGYAPACSVAGECKYEGMCFSRSGKGFKVARCDIEKLIAAEGDVFTRSWLKVALDALDHHQFIGRGAIDALQVVAINKEVRKQYDLRNPRRRQSTHEQ